MNKPEIVALPDGQKMDVSMHPTELRADRMEWEKAHLWARHTEELFQQGHESLSGVTKTKAKAEAAAAKFWENLRTWQPVSETDDSQVVEVTS